MQRAELLGDFDRIFGPGRGKRHVVRAPGRVNLIGEHTDYNEGLVFPMAIEPEIRFVCRSREDALVRLASSEIAADGNRQQAAGSREDPSAFSILHSSLSAPSTLSPPSIASFSLAAKIEP